MKNNQYTLCPLIVFFLFIADWCFIIDMYICMDVCPFMTKIPSFILIAISPALRTVTGT